MKSTDEFLTTEETAKLLKVTTMTLAQWRYRGDGPPFMRLGPRLIRYSRKTVAAFMRETEGRV